MKRGFAPAQNGPPIVSPRRPACPSHLTDEAKTIWRRLAPMAHARGCLDAADVDGFAVLCSSLALLREADRQIAALGGVTSTERGGLRRSPWIQIRECAVKEVLRLAGEYGLSPTGRQRLGIEPPVEMTAEEAEFEKLLD